MKNKEKKRTKHAEKNNDIKIKYYSSGKEESELPFAEDGGQGKKKKKEKILQIKDLIPLPADSFRRCAVCGHCQQGNFLPKKRF